MPETSSALIDQLVYIDNFINNSAGETPNLDADGQLLLDLAAFADESFVFPDEEKRHNPHDEDDNGHLPGSSSNNNADHNLDLFLGKSDFQLPASSANSNDAWFSNHIVDAHPDMHSNNVLATVGGVNERTKLAKINRRNNYGNQRAATQNTGSTALNNLFEHHDDLQPLLLDTENADFSAFPKYPVPPGAKNSLEKAGLSHKQIDLLSALIAHHQNSLNSGDAATNNNTQQGLPQAMVLPELHHLTSESHLASDGHRNSVTSFRSTTSHGVESPGSMTSNYSSEGSLALSTPHVSKSLSNGNNSLVELDKRRRNTAASARFRIKKKIKEKDMESRVMQLNEMINRFELKINELEMENKLLKNLIIEKGNRNLENELRKLKERVKQEDE